jgi:exodeoxyribonuclease-3
MMKRIISYNVNGIRAAISKGLLDWLKSENPDVICLQETKIQEEQIDKMAFEYLGYHQYWSSAQKKGYSGVGILTKQKPEAAHIGMGIEKFDNEGRLLRLDFKDFSLINSYFPSGTTGDVRQDFKMEYLEAIMKYASELLTQKSNLVLCGDYNICHKPIDINHPERHKKSSGFLPEERAWMDDFLDIGFVDSFRNFSQESDKYSWWSYRAGSRAKNLGWRIDYHMVSVALEEKLNNAGIMPDVMHSDHCPVWIDLDLS